MDNPPIATCEVTRNVSLHANAFKTVDKYVFISAIECVSRLFPFLWKMKDSEKSLITYNKPNRQATHSPWLSNGIQSVLQNCLQGSNPCLPTPERLK